jgi:hypothetical protein
MRLASPFSRFVLAASLPSVLASAALAAVEHRVKQEASMFRTRLLEPPPLAQLAEGETVRLLHKGEGQSLVKTESGLRGWMRNGDLVEVTVAGPARHDIGELEIKADAYAYSPYLILHPNPDADIPALERSFADEVVETVDREQLEMRNDEN